MKNNMKNFLLVGALAMGFTASAVTSAQDLQENINLKANIEKSIADSINKEMSSNNPNGLLKEKSKIEVTLLSEQTIQDLKDHKIAIADSGVTRENGACYIRLNYKHDGNIFEMTDNQEILDVTQFNNENQKEIARKFVALHEQVHCEFAAIDNPVQIKGQSNSFNEKMNYILKDQVTNPADNKVSYIDTLNENFADVGATLLLIKEYGATNPDLQFVLNAMKAQRHETYFNERMSVDSHYTHFSLEQAMKQENLDKFAQVKNSNEFKNLVLNIANEGTQQVMINKPEMAKIAFSQEQLDFSLFVKTVITIGFNSKSEDLQFKKDINPWKKGVTRGLAAEVANAMLKGEDLEKLAFYNKDGSPGKNYGETFEFINQLYATKIISPKLKQSFDEAPAQLAELKDIILSQRTNEFDLVDRKLDKNEVKNKIATLRKTFLQETQTNENSNKLVLK